MSELRELSKEIYNRFGTIKRARGCFLYTAKGVRLTDMYQQAGRAILGWGAKGSFTILKNVLERGISGSFITDFNLTSGKNHGQLGKALSSLFADQRTPFLFASKNQAIQTALTISSESSSVYIPWSPSSPNWQNVDCIVFAPTLPWTENIWILAVKSELIPQDTGFPNELSISSPIQAALTRSVYDLIKALQVREEKNWFIYDSILTKYFTRKGPWLYPKVPQERYPDFILHCLDCQLVISPIYNQPSIVPFSADKGNFKLLKNNPFNL